MPRSPQLADGYVSQIQLYRKPMEAATEALDWKMISGSKDEATLDPLCKSLDKAIENLGTALRPIKALFAAWINLCTCVILVVWSVGLCEVIRSRPEVEPDTKKPAKKQKSAKK